MSKKIRLTTFIEIDEGLILDDSMMKRTVGQLGDIISYEVDDSDNFSESGKKEQKDEVIAEIAAGEVVEFIKNTNKIYYGSVNLDTRKSICQVLLMVANLEKIRGDQTLTDKFKKLFKEKFESDDSKIDTVFVDVNDSSLLNILKERILEGDFNQFLIYIWEKVLSKGEEEDDFEIDLIENMGEKFGYEKAMVNETKKLGVERSKVSRSIDSILSEKTAYNKLKAFEKNTLLGLLLAECSTVGGVISNEDSKLFKKLLNDQLNISGNAVITILERKITDSLIKKVEQVEIYREKYELVEFLWEKILSSEVEIDDEGMGLIRKMIRKLDISDIESEGARKEAEENLKETEE